MDKKFCLLKQVKILKELHSLSVDTLKHLQETQFENLASFEKKREQYLHSMIFLDDRIKNSVELISDQKEFEKQKVELTLKINELDEKIYQLLNLELKRLKAETNDLKKDKESVSKFKSLTHLKRGLEVDHKV